jgi:uncharacterized protein YchJ
MNEGPKVETAPPAKAKMDAFLRAGVKCTTPWIAQKRPQLNEPCRCGSGKKFKRCCGRG